MTRYSITTAINYPNGAPHIGHAYEAIVADAFARWHRLAGEEVHFQTGVDEYGLKMVKTAREQGLSPLELTDRNVPAFEAMAEALHLSYDRFVRTTEPAHARAAQALWTRLEATGDLYRDRYEGWYSVRDEAFYAEDELMEEEGGARLSPHGTPVEWTAEEGWFFRLSRYAELLLAHIATNPEFVQPDSRRNEVVRFVESGLTDLSVSRSSFDWGVPVPGDPASVMYVWVDALTNYLTGLGFPDETPDMARFWPADVHLIGKDIVRFHAIYWPALLMSAGLPLPQSILAHGFILNRGVKESKSLGNTSDPMEIVEAFGVDAVRYFLLREVSFGQDGSWSAEAIVTRANADLANNLGNLAQRSLSMVAKQCDGRMPARATSRPEDGELIARLQAAQEGSAAAMRAHQPHLALEAIWGAATSVNGYFADAAPWALRKTDPDRADAVLAVTLDAVRRLAIFASWAVPEGAARLLDQLGVATDRRSFAHLDTPVEPGCVLPAPAGVFPRLEVPARWMTAGEGDPI